MAKKQTESKTMDNQTLEKLKRIYNQADSFGKELMEKEFPELKENEDEMIRHYLIYFVKINNGVNIPPDYAKKALAWLEKQGEQKPAECSEDERVRKALLSEFISLQSKGYKFAGLEGEDIINWLEKQSEQKHAECRQCRQETKPNGGIVYEDFDDGDGYYKVDLAYLSKSQVELIENLVASWQNPTN